ncbi:MAG: acyl-homoserine-lactone synthase [Candidatus Paracaedibacteraceae bacterium]|nr:acyl-homoserine-lactone synthase [Candidatus Paracaedibacteraceae bacterium]
MLILIDPKNYHLHRNDLDEMYRLRHKVFFENMKWNVDSDDGMERDIYDEKNMYYLVYKDACGTIRGCVRFVEMTNDCMFDGPFKFALPNLTEFKRPGHWEISRLAVDPIFNETYTPEMAKNISLNLATGYLYFAIEIEEIQCTLSIAYPKTLELFKMNGLLISEINRIMINEETKEEIVVSSFPSLNYCYTKMTKKININQKKPVLWSFVPMYKDDTEYFLHMKQKLGEFGNATFNRAD